MAEFVFGLCATAETCAIFVYIAFVVILTELRIVFVNVRGPVICDVADGNVELLVVVSKPIFNVYVMSGSL